MSEHHGYHHTPQTLEQRKAIRRLGLVEPGHPALRHPAEEVDPDDITSEEVQGIIGRLHSTFTSLLESGRTPVGLHAVQLGEVAAIALVPHEEEGLMPIINGEPIPAEDSEDSLITHGCFSTDMVCARLWTPTHARLQGYSAEGEQIDIERTGLAAVVDWHELAIHQTGSLPPDVGVATGRQLDWRPPEERSRYTEVMGSNFDAIDNTHPDPDSLEWDRPFQPQHWVSLRLGEISLDELGELEILD